MDAQLNAIFNSFLHYVNHLAEIGNNTVGLVIAVVIFLVSLWFVLKRAVGLIFTIVMTLLLVVSALIIVKNDHVKGFIPQDIQEEINKETTPKDDVTGSL